MPIDPPEQELASLLTTDRKNDDLGNGLEPPSTPSFSHRRHHPTNGYNNGIVQKISLQKKMLIVATLVMIVAMIVIVSSNVDTSMEAEAVTTVEVVSHSSTSTSSSESAGYHNNNFFVGFHEPSFENIYGANYYFKPKGAGYPLAPKGGIHPIYMIDYNNDEAISLPLDFGNYEISPYTDKRLKMTPEQRATEQSEWETKLQQIRDEYGYWNFHDDYPSKHDWKSRPVVVDWLPKGHSNNNPLHGEIYKDDFPQDSWQTDNEYVSNFIKEGRLLIHRVQEGIYAEYGWGIHDKPDLSKEQLEQQRKEYLGIYIASTISDKSVDASKGMAWIYQNSFDALVKKLLNAMITNDHFFVTLGGHSSAAGHGNNFFQSYMMQFHNVMEPVFDRLGMVLVTANRAQGGMGTLQAALAGVDVYGEKDFMVWDSSMTEKDGKLQDVFMRMMLLSGHRVPILFDIGGGKASMDRLHEEVGAHVGGVTSGNPHLSMTESLEQAATLPHAVQHLFCKGGVSTCDGAYKYNASCWTDRVDVDPPTAQNKGYGGQAKWHPGNRSHQLIARRMTLLFLRALDEAMNVWEKAAESDGGNPLDGKYWHLAVEEEKIRNALKTANATATPCGELLSLTPRVCTTSMRGGTEWTPRYRGDESNIRRLLKPSPSGYVPRIEEEEQVYIGRDPLQPAQRIPKGEVDVAMIARSLPPRKKSQRSLSRTETSIMSEATKMYHSVGSKQVSSPNIMLRNDVKQGTIGRHLAEKTGSIVPGEGWAIIQEPLGYCDGTSNAVCYREKSSNCLMSGHNDGRGGLIGDSLSGWLVFNLKDVTKGLFLARLEPWHPSDSVKRTEGLTTVDNEHHRRLKAPPPVKPADWRVEVAVNGVVTKSMNETEFNENCVQPGYNLVICTLWDDKERALVNKKEDVEIAFRTIGAGRKVVIGITHVYYA